MKNDQMLKDLQCLLAQQNFKNEDEMKALMDQLVGKPLPKPSKKNMPPEEWAQELVLEAYDMPYDEAVEAIYEALDLDPDCLEAYEWLGSVGDTPAVALAFFEKAVALGKKRFDEKFLKENKGHYWLIHETRPFMRSLFNVAEILEIQGKTEESIKILEEILELNPGDNMGARHRLGIALIRCGDFKKFEKYDKFFEYEESTETCFNRALVCFSKEGPSPKANELMQEAVNQNGYVVRKLNGPKNRGILPDSYILGSKEEAVSYAAFAQDIWKQTKGALAWAKKFKKKE
ncbi:tetratricopeptide repeat protein [Algoriphagus namhaensis]